MLVAAGLSCYGAITAYRQGATGTQAILWTLTMMTVALAASALVLAWYSGRCRIAAMRRQLERLTMTGRCELLSSNGDGELVGLAAALNMCVAQLRNRVARLQLQKKELDIQTRIAEAEKQCVETIVSKLAEPVLVTDAFDEVVLANRAAQEIFGLTLGGGYRQPIHRALRNPGMVQLIKSMRNSEEPPQRNVKVLLNSDTARPQTFRVSLNRVVDPRGHIHGVVTVLRPVHQSDNPPDRNRRAISQSMATPTDRA